MQDGLLDYVKSGKKKEHMQINCLVQISKAWDVQYKICLYDSTILITVRHSLKSLLQLSS